MATKKKAIRKKATRKKATRKKATRRKAASEARQPVRSDTAGPNTFGGFTYVDKTGKVAKATVESRGQSNGQPRNLVVSIDAPVKDVIYTFNLSDGLDVVEYVRGTVVRISGYSASSTKHPGEPGAGECAIWADLETRFHVEGDPGAGIKTLVENLVCVPIS